MDILILGGTQFVGRTITELALARGHRLTLFNRGSRAGLFPGIEEIHGNRDGGLDALRGRRWDAVIDTCGYLPRVVGDSAQLLADAVERYVFISTISVYRDFSQKDITESAPLGTIDDPTTEQITGESYGPLKVLCEQAVEQALPGRSLIIRPGLIVGPYDPTDRFGYWVGRAAHPGELLAPNTPDMHVQVIDVRDLATWTLEMTEQQAVGVFNATGPASPLTFAEMLETSRSVGGGQAQVTLVDEAWIAAKGIQPWSELPLWVPPSDPDMAGFGDVSIAQAQAAGLVFRPFRDTVRDTLAWLNSRPADHQWRAGLSPEREAELLAAWHQEHQSV